MRNEQRAWGSLLRVGAVAGLIGGGVSGIVARGSMRAFAVAQGMETGFSIGGTLFIVFVFAVVLGMPLALAYVGLRRASSSVSIESGLAFGVVLLIALIFTPFLLIPNDEADLALRLIAIATFVPVPLVYGLTLGYVASRLWPSVQPASLTE